MIDVVDEIGAVVAAGDNYFAAGAAERLDASFSNPAFVLKALDLVNDLEMGPEALAALLDGCSEPVLLARWQRALLEINGHWDRLLAGEPALRSPARWRIQAQQWGARLAKLAR